MRVRWGLSTVLVAVALLAASGVLPARVRLPLGPAVAHAQTDCDGDGDGGQDLNEYSECFEPPPLPEHPFDEIQKSVFRGDVYTAYNYCNATGHPLPYAPIEPPNPPLPGEFRLPPEVQHVYYSVLASEFATMCGDQAAMGVYAASMLSVDPPDPNAAVIPLPRAAAVPRPSAPRCRSLARRWRASCRRFATAAFNYAASVKRAKALTEAMAVAGNRFANEQPAALNFNTGVAASAIAIGDLVAEHAYAGQLVSADGAMHRAGLKLAKTMKRVRLDPRFTARQVRARRHSLTKLQGFPHGFVASLRADALDPKAIEATLAHQLARAKVAPFDLITVLRRHIPTAALTSTYDSTTVSQLADLVAALTAQGVASSQVNVALNDDLQNAGLASDAAERKAAMKQFVADSRRLLTGPYSALLQTAALPLTR